MASSFSRSVVSTTTASTTTARAATRTASSYLDGSLFCFSTATTTTNISPIASSFPPGNTVTLDAGLGDVLNLDVSFLSPEAGQTTTVAINDIDNAVGAGLAIVTTAGNIATVGLDWTPDCADVGTYALQFTATDDFNPPGVTNIVLTINVTCSTGCAAGPLSCTAAGKSILLLKDKSPAGGSAKDKLVWKWLKGPAAGQADFGNPSSTAAYDLCIYGGPSAALVMEASVPAGGTCGGKPCWKAIGAKGYKYRDKSKANDGIFKILLKGSGAGKSTVLVKGKDANLDMPGVPLDVALDPDFDVTVQLRNSDNANCWESVFRPGSVKKSSGDKFKAKTP